MNTLSFPFRSSFLLLCMLLLVSCAEESTDEQHDPADRTAADADAELTGNQTGSSAGSPGETAGAPAPSTDRDSGPIIGLVTGMKGEPLPGFGEVNYSLVSMPAPDIVWKTVEGQPSSLKEYRGKVLLINFWGTWCPPCRRELPDIVAIREEFRDRGFEVIGVAVNERPAGGRSIPENLAAFAEANDLDYPLVVSDAAGEVSSYYGQPPSVPTTFVVNRQGQVVDVLVGARSAEEFRNAIAPHL